MVMTNFGGWTPPERNRYGAPMDEELYSRLSDTERLRLMLEKLLAYYGNTPVEEADPEMLKTLTELAAAYQKLETEDVNAGLYKSELNKLQNPQEVMG